MAGEELRKLVEQLENGDIDLDEFRKQRAILDAKTELENIDAETIEVADINEPEKSSLKGCLWIIGIVVGVPLLITVFALLSGSDDDDKPSPPTGYEAEMQCERWVKEKLKAPATAKFSNGNYTSNGGSSWTVTGSVDAENSFGALVRSDWTCDIRLDGDTWRGKALLTE